MSSSAAYTTGLTTGLGLIVAIGAQNAFVLRQGLRREHVFAVVMVCALSDALLIALGVSGFRQIMQHLPWLDPLMRYGGALFLLCYGLKSLLAAWRGQDRLGISQAPAGSLFQTLLTCLAFTWLNPHVYLDTLVLLGTISTRFTHNEAAFALGASTASFGFFFALGYAARLLRPLLSRPAAWQVLETLIGLAMLGLAGSLLLKR